MNREQQEMALWRRVFERWYSRDNYEVDTCGGIADAAVAQFRKRFPVEPAAPDATWYDEPPFAKDGATRPCWIAGSGRLYLALVYWGGRNWRVSSLRDQNAVDLDSRRVCPIHKPQEPTT